eukprot:759570-Hanusia_phi.AAC.1
MQRQTSTDRWSTSPKRLKVSRVREVSVPDLLLLSLATRSSPSLPPSIPPSPPPSLPRIFLSSHPTPSFLLCPSCSCRVNLGIARGSAKQKDYIKVRPFERGNRRMQDRTGGGGGEFLVPDDVEEPPHPFRARVSEAGRWEGREESERGRE